MAYPWSLTISLILLMWVYFALALAASEDLSSGKLRDAIGFRSETRSRLKFPNNFKFQSGHFVRSPQGNWARSGNNVSSDTSSEGFVFPDHNEDKRDKIKVRIDLPKLPKKVPPECANSDSFCETVDDYPEQYLDNVLEMAGSDIKLMFGKDTTPEIQQRIDNTDEDPLCISQEQIVFPKMAKNQENVWLFVVNTGSYIQGVRVEKCVQRDESKSCSFTEGFPLGYKTVCKQKYIYRKMIALNEEGKTVADNFQLPSCCSCVVKHEGISKRFGFPGRGAQPNSRNATNSTSG